MRMLPTTDVRAAERPRAPARTSEISSSSASLTLRREVARVCPRSQSTFSGRSVTEIAFLAIR
jgi:hypothetical protein